MRPYADSLRRLIDRSKPDAAATRIDADVKTLPEKLQDKVQRLAAEKINVETAVLRKTFYDEVNTLADKRTHEREAKLAEREKLVETRLKRLDAWMTEEEFKLVLGCLHPDSTPSHERKARAFAVFNRLKAQLSKDASTLRGNGWSKPA
jgi:glutamyl-tRNA reductase